MSYSAQAVIARRAGAAAEIAAIEIPDPGPGEAVVRVAACGICATDLHYRDGLVGDDYPYLLGHEAAGHVVAVGAGVTEVAPGDYVVLNWRAVCGTCRACRRGRPQYCFATKHAHQSMRLAAGPDRGQPLTAALGIGALCEYTLVAAGQCTQVDPATPASIACLLGCGIVAGFGAAVTTAPVRPGDSVAVIGAGTVGCAAVLGASFAGARQVISVSRNPRRLAAAAGFGATKLINSTEVPDVVAAIKEATGGFGADVVIDAAGLPATWRQAFYARDLAGTVVLVGVPTGNKPVPDIPLADVFGYGGALKSSWYGDCLPSRDLPLLADLFVSGRLPLAGFVTETIELADALAAFDRLRRGEVLRSVVNFTAPA